MQAKDPNGLIHKCVDGLWINYDLDEDGDLTNPRIEGKCNGDGTVTGNGRGVIGTSTIGYGGMNGGSSIWYVINGQGTVPFYQYNSSGTLVRGSGGWLISGITDWVVPVSEADNSPINWGGRVAKVNYIAGSSASGARFTAKYAKHAKLGKIGPAGFIVGVSADLANKDISKTHKAVNATFSAIGLIPTPWTIGASIVYGGVDNFYPGGWTGWWSDVQLIWKP